MTDGAQGSKGKTIHVQASRAGMCLRWGMVLAGQVSSASSSLRLFGPRSLDLGRGHCRPGGGLSRLQDESQVRSHRVTAEN